MELKLKSIICVLRKGNGKVISGSLVPVFTIIIDKDEYNGNSSIMNYYKRALNMGYTRHQIVKGKMRIDFNFHKASKFIPFCLSIFKCLISENYNDIKCNITLSSSCTYLLSNSGSLVLVDSEIHRFFCSYLHGVLHSRVNVVSRVSQFNEYSNNFRMNKLNFEFLGSVDSSGKFNIS